MPDSELYQWRESSSHSAGPSLNCARNGAIGSPLSDRDGFRTDVIAALRELSIPVVRWPGGCFASAYHWLDGVGNPRRPSFDKAWGVEDSNLFGTGEFVKWCRRRSHPRHPPRRPRHRRRALLLPSGDPWCGSRPR